ncbi:MAG: hypothetical protein OER56_14545 [Hyphomicrobiales bacterium]|nr:hypothetical protein [Hyphomicrobiales bacterium]
MQISDIEPLFGNEELKIVGVRGKGPVDCNRISELRRRLSPGAKVYGQRTCDRDKPGRQKFALRRL